MPVVGGAGRGLVGVATLPTAVPQVGQNRVPGESDAPHELQNCGVVGGIASPDLRRENYRQQHAIRGRPGVRARRLLAMGS